ncbi:MAG: hypothetical protein HC888_11345 [Candidatus Competibacteraceae bacterium]|nr:hypothetical protein [Candidatus Competibacteraceae bacterium]
MKLPVPASASRLQRDLEVEVAGESRAVLSVAKTRLIGELLKQRHLAGDHHHASAPGSVGDIAGSAARGNKVAVGIVAARDRGSRGRIVIAALLSASGKGC